MYLLRVKKKNDATEGGNKRNLEVELRTPKPPPPAKPAAAAPAVPQPVETSKPVAQEKMDKGVGGDVAKGKKKKGKKKK